MSWEAVPQRSSSKATDCAVSLKPRSGGHHRLNVTISGALAAQLGWSPTAHVSLEVGRDADAGKVRIVPADSGARLRKMPNSDFLSVALAVPEDFERWTAEKTDAVWERGLKGSAAGKAMGILVVTLPWDLNGDPPGEAEAAADQERIAA